MARKKTADPTPSAPQFGGRVTYRSPISGRTEDALILHARPDGTVVLAIRDGDHVTFAFDAHPAAPGQFGAYQSRSAGDPGLDG